LNRKNIIFFLILLQVVGFGQKRFPTFVSIPISVTPILRNQKDRQFNKGIEHYNVGRFYSALDIFRRLSGLPPSKNRQITACYLMTMKSYFQVGNLSDAIVTGQQFLVRFPTSSYRKNIYECFGDIFVTKGRYRSAVQNYLIARTLTDSEMMRSRLDQRLIHLSNSLLSKAEIEDLLVFENDSENRTIVTLMLAHALLAGGKSNEAVVTLFRMDAESIPPSFQESYENLKKRSYVDSGESVVIGVVLPLSSYDESVGNAFLRGIQAAVESLRERFSKTIILEVMDNGGDILRTISNIQILSSNPNLVAIIGPLSTVNAVIAATAAGLSGVPLLIPMSTQVGLSDVSNNIFQMTADFHKQGRYAADYAVSSLGLETLAVLAPADRLGKELSDGFVQRADELGAEIVTIEWYSGVPIDLSRQLTSLRKVAFQLFSQQPDTSGQNLELDTLDNTFILFDTDFFSETVLLDDELIPKDSSELILSTIEGIYLPIHQGDINYVVSQFSAYNLETQLLGNSNWYNPEELGQEMISSNVNGMIVLTDYLNLSDWEVGDYQDSKNLQVKDRNEYRIIISGYDIMTFLTGQLGDNPSRTTVLENLSKEKSFRGTGRFFSFTDAPARVNSSLFVLEYRNSRFIKVGEINSDSLSTYKVQSP